MVAAAFIEGVTTEMEGRGLIGEWIGRTVAVDQDP
jgi:hypothetical protein